MIQVELDLKALSKIVDEHGDINREDFTKFAQDTKLTDFHVVEGVPFQKHQAKKLIMVWNFPSGAFDKD